LCNSIIETAHELKLAKGSAAAHWSTDSSTTAVAARAISSKSSGGGSGSGDGNSTISLCALKANTTATRTLTMIEGRLTRPMAMRHPGMFLSHPGIAMLPSYHWPPMTVSMESAITSRDCRENDMPTETKAVVVDRNDNDEITHIGWRQEGKVTQREQQ